ncbi:MAG: hypothetical protein NXI10_05700 [bacterium]|nr:hypothetical protein [bacterium]
MTRKKLKDIGNKSFSVVLIYAILIQQIIPFGYASGSENSVYVSHNSKKVVRGVDSKLKTDTISEQFEQVNNSVKNSSSEKYIPVEELNQTGMAVQMTSEGGQTETSGYSLNSTDGMVDKFTGDFSYQIPLMDVEGYPIVISYNSNVGMNQEASWVGLGWNLSVGSVSRDMRGLPDEFNGDQNITKTINQKNIQTTNGKKIGASIAFGNSGLGLTALGGGYDNSYLGNGKTFDFNARIPMTKSIGENYYLNGSFNFGFSVDTKNGIGRNWGLGITPGNSETGKSLNLPTYGRSFNSRIGLTAQSISFSKAIRNTDLSISSSFKYGSNTTSPASSFNNYSTSNSNSFNAFVSFSVGNVGLTTSALTQFYNDDAGILHDNSAQVIQHPAYGYLHSGKRLNDSNQDNLFPVMDFNRVNDYGYSEEMKNLPFSFQTYDVFNVNAVGINGNFRARRTDFGTYKDPETKADQDGDENDFTAGFQPVGMRVILGYGKGSQDGDSKTGTWNNILEFTSEAPGVEFDNTVYFKGMGEMTPEDLTVYNQMGGNKAGYFDINKVGEDIVQSNYLKLGNSGVNINGSTVNGLSEKPVRATVYNPLIAQNHPNPNFEEYAEGVFTPPTINTIGRTSNSREANHISSFSVVNTNGAEYTYGIPAYTLETNEVMFSVDGSSFDPTTGLVNYSSGDNTINNNEGRAGVYNKTTTPAYAHSFLLTELKSSDYVDVDNNGVSPDDIGSYHKFNYSQVYGENSTNGTYEWRFPISDNSGNQAMYNRGFEGTELDNTANYTHGEKEVWYTHSVEGRNLIAEFYLEDREDAYGVLDENGQIDVTKPLKKLKWIKLYVKSEREDPVNGANAEPIQMVEFDYDYSLCKGNPANKNTNVTPDPANSGKLTLKGIRVYSGSSVETALNNYSFEYSSFNPDFSYANIDGWGAYKQYDPNKPTHIYPYAEQNEANADLAAEAWRLVAINQPNGGRVEVDYEADRYVNVQNKRTMKHMDVHRMTNLIEFLHIQNQSSWNGTDNAYMSFRKDFGGISGLQSFFQSNGYGAPFSFTDFYNATVLAVSYAQYNQKFGKFKTDFVPNNVIVFKLEDNIDGALNKTDASAIVKEDYFATKEGVNQYLKQLYFKMHVRVKDENGTDIKEYVPAFADISDDFINPFGSLLPYEDDFNAIGVMPPASPGAAYEYGYVVVNPTNSGSREKKNKEGNDKDGILLHPIQRQALDFVRQNLPDKVYGSCVGCDPNLSVDVKTFFGGDMYKYLIKDGSYADIFYNDHSTVRLHFPGDIKFGGGSRVKSITYKDGWDVISEESGLNEVESSYKWAYEYPSRFEESGVASYEPTMIKDESAFYYWDTYFDLRKKFPDERNFTPTPVVDALFPTPSVGYQKVKVYLDQSTVGGYSLTKYYTAKDFPTKYDKTPIERSEDKDWTPFSSGENYGFAQGFSVETNNFHGLPHTSGVYRIEGNAEIMQSETEYVYRGLSESVQMIDRKGVVTDENVALEFDIHEDSRFSTSNSIGINIGATVSFSVMVPFLPIIVKPSISFTKREDAFYSNALVKHINRAATIESIETRYLSSSNSARNILFDKYTGEVLLSSLTDEYEDDLYSFLYPSHWYEAELRDLNSTENVTYNVSITGSIMDVSGLSNHVFTPGDRLLVSDGVSTANAVILSIDGSNVKLITDSGMNYFGVTGAVTVEILQSGRKNRLEEVMQQVTTKNTITPVSGSVLTFPETNILSASAINYRNKTNIKCRIGDGEQGDNNEVIQGSIINPFDYGIMGDIVLDGQFMWQTERVHDLANHGTRFDGEYTSYMPFYEMDGSGVWHAITDPLHTNYDGSLQDWRKMGEVTRYDEFGRPVEQADQIDVFSSMLFGFNKELSFLPVAQAVNAMQRDIAFDSFEDYNFYSQEALDYQETHFDFADALGASVQITQSEKHSGWSSLQISAGASASVIKGVSTGCENPGDGVIGNDNNTSPITADECYCVQPFKPREGDYIIGAWVKVGNDPTNLDYSDASITVSVAGGTTYLGITASGPIIDGWQRLEGEFSIPTSATGVTITINNGSAEENVYIDDMRIHPFTAGMTTTVYDPVTLLPVASHDGYNYTTFYNYDENLNLVRVRVETEKGIQTVKESEFGTQKNYNN